MINQSFLIALNIVGSSLCEFYYCLRFLCVWTSYILLFLFVFLLSLRLLLLFFLSFCNEFLFEQQTLNVIDIMFIILISCVK